MLSRMARVLVTGAASGIGAACATVLEREGWEVVRADVAVGSTDIVELDVGDEASWSEVMRRIGSLDALATCAGIRSRNLIVDTDLDEWERHLRVNLTGTWLGIRSFFRALDGSANRTRSIVTVASINATLAVPGQAHYVASKGGVTALTRAAAVEGAPLGVRVNAVAPGPIDTPMTAERRHDPEQVAWLSSRVPLGRFGEPGEVAELVEFLLGERASYISGEVVYVDGGWAANAV